MASYIPGPPQFGQGGGGGEVLPGANPSNLVQLAMQVKAFKMQEAEQKRQQAQQKAQLLMSNPQLLLMTDPKDIEKALKEGYGLNFDEKQPANPNTAQPKPAAGGGTGGQPQPTNIDPNAMASLANATQGGKAGAQAASPPSASAASKAPGGGVTPTSFGPTADAMAAKAAETFQAKFGAMAPMYGSAMGQVQLEAIKADTMREIEDLRQRVAANGDIRAQARLAALGGQKITDADIRGWVIAGGGDSTAFNQAMDVALQNETGAAKGQRFTDTLKTLSGNQQLMDRLENPADVARIASSIVYGGSLPQNVAMKPMGMGELKAEADYENDLMKNQGVPYEVAHLVARARSLGVSPTQSLPPAMQSFVSGQLMKQPIASRETGAKEATAQADMIKALADKEKADDEHSHIEATLHQKKYDLLNDRLKTMIEAQKAGHPFPQEVQEGLLAEVAHEVGYSQGRVQHWYQYITGGHDVEYSPVPASDLAREAAGGGKPNIKNIQRIKPGKDAAGTPQ